MGLSSSLKTATYRAANNIQVTLTSDAKVRFTIKGKTIPGCASIQSISLVATCAWKPSIHNTAEITAQIINSASSSSLILGISNRVINR
jgi:hypothetical protein